MECDAEKCANAALKKRIREMTNKLLLLKSVKLKYAKISDE